MLQKGAVLLALALVAGCGSSIATESEPVAHHLVYEKLTGKGGIWIADVDGSHARQLVADGQEPFISPDGKWVAYAGGECELDSPTCGTTYLVSTEPGAKPRPLEGDSGWQTEWLPDSRAFVTQRGLNVDEDELVRIDIADGKETTLARGEFWGWSLSPDGKSLVFARARGDAPGNAVFPVIDLYVVDTDGRGDPKAITNTGDSAYPVWGPKSIAFAKLIPVNYPNSYGAFAKNEIWQIQPDGTGERTISGPMPERVLKVYPLWHCVGLEPIDWSDDGSVLLAEVGCEATGQTVAVDPQTGTIRSLGEATFTFALSQDAQFALVQWGDERVGAENERVLIYPYSGGKAQLIATGATGASWNR